MDNFNLRKFLAEGKLYEDNSSREKQHLLKWLKDFQDYFDEEYNYFELGDLDHQMNGDGTDLVHDFITYLNDQYSHSGSTPDILGEFDVNEFLSIWNDKDYSSDFINEKVEEMDCVEEFMSGRFSSKEELSKWLVLTCGDYGVELICQEIWGGDFDIEEDGYQSALWDLEEWYEKNIGFKG